MFVSGNSFGVFHSIVPSTFLFSSSTNSTVSLNFRFERGSPYVMVSFAKIESSFSTKETGIFSVSFKLTTIVKSS